MKIAILITCNDKSEFVRRHPDDGETFTSLLCAVRPDWEYCPIPVCDNVFPEHPEEYDGYIVCGSSASVHDRQGWIIRLLQFIRQLDKQKIPTFGCCFGHQAIASALGGEVSGNQTGWSVGSETTRIVRREDWLPPDARQIRLHSAHQEQVSALPAGCRVVGVSRGCPIASLARGDHIFTTQYHPEMTRPFVQELVEDMARELGDKLDMARSMAEHAAQGNVFADWIARFFEYASIARTAFGPQSPDPVDVRYEAAMDIARQAGQLAMRYFGNLGKLKIESKGPNDPVSNADKDVEQLIRREIGNRFPNDGIVGEEFLHKPPESSFTWVIDPIDGTANFVCGVPTWAVVIACVRGSATVVGVIHDPIHNEMHHCRRNRGAWLNGKPGRTAQSAVPTDGILGIGVSPKCRRDASAALLQRILDEDITFARAGSGALGIAYVAAGRHLGFLEEHHNAWDCLAGLLLVEEAGGITIDHDAEHMINNGGMAFASAPFVYESNRSIAEHAFGNHSG